MNKRILIALLLGVGFVCDMFGAWTCSDSTLTWTDNETEYWKLSVSVVDKEVTLTSLASTIPSDKTLDLTGALEAYGLTESGYSLAFVEGDGLSVFSSVQSLTITGQWFALMKTSSGAALTALKSVVLGTAGVDLQLGDTTATTGDAAAPVFASTKTLENIRVFGKNLSLIATFVQHRVMKTVSLRATGDLNLGYCVFYPNATTYYSIQYAEFVSGGNLTLNNSSVRNVLAKDAQVYVEAPVVSAASRVTLSASTFQSSKDYPFCLYWNAPRPTDSRNIFASATFDWQICNAPAIVETFPEMDGENLKSLGTYTFLRLPADASDTETDGNWQTLGKDKTTVNASGTAHWCARMSAGDAIAGTNGWTYTRSTGRLVQTNAQGEVRWELSVAVDLNDVTLTPVTTVAPADGVFSLAGADLALLWTDVNLSFAEGTGAFASVTALDLRGIPWLRQMNQQAAAPFTALVTLQVGTPEADLQLGDNTTASGNVYPAYSVFTACDSLRDVQIGGRNVVLNNTFVGHGYVTNAVVRALGDLTVGPGVFFGTKYGSSVQHAEFVAAGDLTFGNRALYRAFAKKATMWVTATATSTTTLGEYAFNDRGTEGRHLDLYWNAPAPSATENSMSIVDLTWYVYNDSASTATFQDPTGTKQLDGGYVTISLPENVLKRHTPGTWRYGEGTAYPAYWYGKAGGFAVIFR